MVMTIARAIVLAAVLVLLAAPVYAADCNNGGRYEDLSDGTVQDCRTGLIWLKEVKCNNTFGGITPNASGNLNWASAKGWVAALYDTGSPATSCGLSDGSVAGDWRLPTKTEWMAMVAYAKKQGYSPSLTDGTGVAQWTSASGIFANLESNDYYWSYTQHPTFSGSAMLVWMFDGSVTDAFKTNLYHIWPVRGGQSGSFGYVSIH